jgi:hypothetical protein
MLSTNLCILMYFFNGIIRSRLLDYDKFILVLTNFYKRCYKPFNADTLYKHVEQLGMKADTFLTLPPLSANETG